MTHDLSGRLAESPQEIDEAHGDLFWPWKPMVLEQPISKKNIEQ